jgi:enolase
VEAEVIVGRGTTPLAVGRAIAPAGASTGSGEAKSIDARAAAQNISTRINDGLRAHSVADQEAIDRRLIELDGTPDRHRLGANAIVAVSIACAQAAAASSKKPLWKHLAGERRVALPVPQIQVFGGGAHASRRVDVQDFMVVCPGAASFAEAIAWTAEVHRSAGELMAARGRLAGVADEGGWWPDFASNEEALETLVAAIERAGRVPGDEVAIALDVAASELGSGGSYALGLESRRLDRDQWIELLLGWTRRYPIVSIEDPLAEDDDEGFARFTRAAGERMQVVGDDFLVSDAALVRDAAALGAANAVLLKPNQRGTLTETLDAWRAAQDVGYAGIVSARSGESEDTTIVHLAVGWRVGQLKVGSFARSERMAKWNEALRIEERLGARARFAGATVFGRSRPRV